MERVIERCAGLDVHKKTVAACVRVRGTQHVRTFGTTATELLVLRDWLFAPRLPSLARTGGMNARSDRRRTF